MNKIRRFVITAITEGEFGTCVKFQYKNEFVKTDPFGTKTHKESETYYRWYDTGTLAPEVVIGYETDKLNPDDYDQVKKAFVLPDGEIIMLTYLYDFEPVNED